MKGPRITCKARERPLRLGRATGLGLGLGLSLAFSAVATEPTSKPLKDVEGVRIVMRQSIHEPKPINEDIAKTGLTEKAVLEFVGRQLERDGSGLFEQADSSERLEILIDVGQGEVGVGSKVRSVYANVRISKDAPGGKAGGKSGADLPRLVLWESGISFATVMTKLRADVLESLRSQIMYLESVHAEQTAD